MPKKENAFQRNLIKEIKERFPGCVVLKNDPNYIQGFPDLTVLYGKHWAVLECKREADSDKQANQEYYVSQLDGMSFSRFIFPENRKEILDELQRSFET